MLCIIGKEIQGIFVCFILNKQEPFTKTNLQHCCSNNAVMIQLEYPTMSASVFFTMARHMLIISLEGNDYDIKVFLWMRDCVCDQRSYEVIFTLIETFWKHYFHVVFCFFSAQRDQHEIRSRWRCQTFKLLPFSSWFLLRV